MSEVGEHDESLIQEFFLGLQEELDGLRVNYWDNDPTHVVKIPGQIKVNKETKKALLELDMDTTSITYPIKHPDTDKPIEVVYALASFTEEGKTLGPENIGVFYREPGQDPYKEEPNIKLIDQVKNFSQAAESFKPIETGQTE